MADSTTDGGAGRPDIQFATVVISTVSGGDMVFHDNDKITVQWSAINAGAAPSPASTDILVVSSIPEGCPGDDSLDHPVVFNSETQAENPQGNLEGALNPGQAGSLMRHTGLALRSRKTYRTPLSPTA